MPSHIYLRPVLPRKPDHARRNFPLPWNQLPPELLRRAFWYLVDSAFPRKLTPVSGGTHSLRNFITGRSSLSLVEGGRFRSFRTLGPGVGNKETAEDSGPTPEFFWRDQESGPPRCSSHEMWRIRRRQEIRPRTGTGYGVYPVNLSMGHSGIDRRMVLVSSTRLERLGFIDTFIVRDPPR